MSFFFITLLRLQQYIALLADSLTLFSLRLFSIPSLLKLFALSVHLTLFLLHTTMDTTANNIEKLLRVAEDTLCEYSESAERLDAKRELLRQLRALARNVHRDESPRAVPSVSYSRPKYVPKWLNKRGGDCEATRSTAVDSGNSDTNRDTRHYTNHDAHNAHNKGTPRGVRDTIRDTRDREWITNQNSGWITNRDSAKDTIEEVTTDTPTKSNSSSPISLTDKQLRDKKLLKRLTGTQKPKPKVELAAGWTRPAGLKPSVKVAQVTSRQILAEEPEPAVPVQREVRLRQVRVRGTR